MRAVARPILAAALILPLLSSCVAAALPVLAAGGVLKASTDSREERVAERGPPRVAIPADPPPASQPQANGAAAGPSASAPGAIVRSYEFSDGSRIEVTNTMGAALGPDAGIAAPAPINVVMVPEETRLAAVPAGVPAPLAAAPQVAAGTAYADFAGFVRTQASVPAVGSERRSAMLADSSELAPETRTCSIHPAAVLIDLDPAGGTIDLARPLAADPAFAASLAELRREGVEIGWVSSRTADRAGAIRKALATAGLDPDGRDQLVLLRFPEERKQTRREDFAKAHCVLAIAGDERPDFDELFAYLLDPTSASPLDTLIGKGWFLVPPPLN